jgi:hypothetical protein
MPTKEYHLLLIQMCYVGEIIRMDRMRQEVVCEFKSNALPTLIFLRENHATCTCVGASLEFYFFKRKTLQFHFLKAL